jgi:TPR repeat protein
VEWYRKAAEQGDAGAQNVVGMCYEKGEGVEQSYKVAAEWYSMAAEQKNEEAMCNLGNCYRYGRGVKRSYNEAVKWYKESGTKDAQTALNEIYSKNLLRRWVKIIQFKFGILK